MDVCRDLGLDGVELTQYYFPEESDEYLHYVKREAFTRGLDICGAAVGGNFSNGDADARRKQIEHVKDWLVKSGKLGATCLRVFAGGQPEGVDLETARGWIIEGLHECAPVAAECGVILALENHGGVTSDADGVLALLEPFAEDPWIGLNLDFGNFTGDIYGQYEQCAYHAVTTHVKVTVRQGDEREAVDYRRVVRILRDIDYRGYLSIEYEEPEDPIVGVDRFAAYLRGCIVDA
jgi:sugar phosphate isomerase/epimerase